MTQQIWQWANSRNIWHSSFHLVSANNVTADKESRNSGGFTEWSLNVRVFEDISDKWGPFQIDLFASTLNRKVPDYVSWSKLRQSSFSMSLSEDLFFQGGEISLQYLHVS